MLKQLIFWLGVFFTLNISASEVPQVVVTIKPIHALVSGVMERIGTPRLLLQGGESPHIYNLRPSQVRLLHTANLIIWVGPTVETFLAKKLTTLGNKIHQLRLIDSQNLTLLKVRSSNNWKTHRINNSGSIQKIDPHIWLNPSNAKIIVQTIAHTLSQIDANNAANYTANALHLIAKLDQLDQELKLQLTPIKSLSYLVLHDAYQYFEHHYGLAAKGAISLSPQTRTSAKHLSKLQVTIRLQKVRCIFSEPQLESALLNTIIANTSISPRILDPLGTSLAVGTEAYFTLLRNLAKSLVNCEL